jgi:integrase
LVRWEIAAKWGLRQGEVLGLFWSDITLDTGRVDIRRQVQRQAGQGLVYKPPKADSFRNLFLDADTLAHLNVLYAAVSTHGVGGSARDDRVVFPSKRGTAVDPMNDQHRFKALLKQAAIRSVNVHALRHTALTRLIEQGVGLPVVQEIAGHSDIRTTMKYLHLADSPVKQDAAALLQRAYATSGAVITLPVNGHAPRVQEAS